MLRIDLGLVRFGPECKDSKIRCVRICTTRFAYRRTNHTSRLDIKNMIQRTQRVTRFILQTIETHRAVGLGVVSALVTFFCIGIPRIVPLAVAGVMLSICAFHLAQSSVRGELVGTLKDLLFRPEVAFLAWVLLACLWSVRPEQALMKALFLVTLIPSAFFIVKEARQIGERDAKALFLGLLVGTLLGGLYVCLELSFNNSILRFVLTLLPDLDRGVAKQAAIEGDFVVAVTAGHITRVSVVFCLFIFPAALATKFYTAGALRWGAYILLILLAFLCLALPNASSQSAQLAILVGTVCFALAIKFPPIARWAVGTLFGGLLFLIVPLSFALFAAELHLKDGFLSAGSGQARVIIWHYTAERVVERPILGVGTNSTRFLDERRRMANELEKPEGFVVVPQTRAHPHNVYLQIWYELGLIGALTFAIFGFSLLQRVSTLPLATQPYAFAQIGTGSIIITPSYGLWQGWFQAVIVISAMMLAIAACVPLRRSQMPCCAADAGT